ncbi:uncharacterized protein At3g49055 isoform X2 [Rhododendron vialii]|uniref:uncharacterized protein At3g49055 isoform X2 n=1 Tax=Rhododendron vialii TaxID=182163 RepID=UPI00265F6A3C|nr:uncharacterized protein At3g49055 isoform X2 [Rhododendron vialii]
MDPTETSSSSDTQIIEASDDEDLPIADHKLTDDLTESRLENESLVAQLEALRRDYHNLQAEHASTEERLSLLEQQNDEVLKHNEELEKALEDSSEERESILEELRGVRTLSREREVELERRVDEEFKEKEGIRSELEGSRERVRVLLDEKSERVRVLSERLGMVKSAKECLVRVIESLSEDNVERFVDEEGEGEGETELEEDIRDNLREVNAVSRLVIIVEVKASAFVETRKKEKRELESSVVSLTEENRDINSLLRIALVEKEAVEKSLNKLKGNSYNSDQKRVAILQIAERGLQKVGFGFMMGAGTNEQPVSDTSSVNSGNKSDGSECEEEVVSLASTVERIMKNLRLEITQLRRSLEESRSDTERLQTLMEKQAQKIAENTLYIKELEDRETMLTQNVEEILMEIKETEEEVSRWREACELEVEAGKNVVEERDKVSILKQELEKTKAALDISNGKLKLKEELADAAMAAQAAAERSLQLADSRAAGLNERIEELTKQLEEVESRERSRRKVRRICWPWRTHNMNSPPNSTNTRARDSKQMLPEMEALLHYNV